MWEDDRGLEVGGGHEVSCDVNTAVYTVTIKEIKATDQFQRTHEAIESRAS